MRSAVLLPANCNLFLPLLEVSVRDFPYSAGVPATLKHCAAGGLFGSNA